MLTIYVLLDQVKLPRWEGLSSTKLCQILTILQSMANTPYNRVHMPTILVVTGHFAEIPGVQNLPTGKFPHFPKHPIPLEFHHSYIFGNDILAFLCF